MSGLKISSSVKIEIEEFVGNINFGLRQIQIKDVLIQFGLHKTLKGKPYPTFSSGSGTNFDGQNKFAENSQWVKIKFKSISALSVG